MDLFANIAHTTAIFDALCHPTATSIVDPLVDLPQSSGHSSDSSVLYSISLIFALLSGFSRLLCKGRPTFFAPAGVRSMDVFYSSSCGILGCCKKRLLPVYS